MCSGHTIGAEFPTVAELRALPLQAAGVKPFPSPFVEGFGWDESGELMFPDRPEVPISLISLAIRHP